MSSLDQKSFQELVFKAVNNLKRSGYVDCRSIDLRNLFFFDLKLLILRQWWQLWMKSAAIKQRYSMIIFFAVFFFCLFYCRTRLVNWFTIDVSWHVSFLLKLYSCIRVCKRTTGPMFLCFSLLFSVVQLWNYTETIIRLRLGEYCRIIPSTSSRGLFNNYSTSARWIWDDRYPTRRVAPSWLWSSHIQQARTLTFTSVCITW